MAGRLALEDYRTRVRPFRSDRDLQAVGSTRAGRVNVEADATVLHQVADALSIIRCTAAGEQPISASIQEERWRLLPAPIAAAGKAAVASRAEATSR